MSSSLMREVLLNSASLAQTVALVATTAEHLIQVGVWMASAWSMPEGLAPLQLLTPLQLPRARALLESACQLSMVNGHWPPQAAH